MNREAERKRLVELIENRTCRNSICKPNCADCENLPFTDEDVERLVDYLLDNGIVVPPVKVGDKVYVIKRCRCGKPENYALKICGRKIVSKTPKVLARVMLQETGKRLKPNYTGKIEYEVAPKGTICYSLYEKPFTLKMLTEIDKTVFLTREQAEKALEGSGEK